MKKLIYISAVLLAVFVISGCASMMVGAGQAFVSNAAVEVCAEETNTVWFGIFGEKSYPSAAKVAADNGISKIASVERYIKIGVFGLWADYTTVVSGE